MEITDVIFGRTIRCGARITLRSGGERIVELRAACTVKESDFRVGTHHRIFSNQLPGPATWVDVVSHRDSKAVTSPEDIHYLTGNIEVSPDDLPQVFRKIREQGVWNIHPVEK